MLKTKLFTRHFFLAAFLLGLLGVESCQIDSETKTLEVTPSSISTNQTDKTAVPASYIKHYTQKVLTDDNGEKYVSEKSEGFAYVESEDKSDNPIETGTKFKELAKDYEGYSFYSGFQKEKTVYLYYTRNTVEYSFYKDENTLLTKIPGTYGLKCTKPEAFIDNKPVVKWNTKPDGKGTSLPDTFDSEDAVFYANGTGIGTKVNPTAAGDIIYADGSVSTTDELASADDEIKKQAIAVIIFDHYDTYSGSFSDGNKLIGIGLRALEMDDLKASKWRNHADVYKTLTVNSNHGYYDFQKLKLNYGKSKTDLEDYWTAYYKASTYTDNFTDIDITYTLKENWYLPSWKELGYTFAQNYKYYQILYNACLALGTADTLKDNHFWATPHQIFEDTNYCAYITQGKNWKELVYFVKGKDKPEGWENQWKDGDQAGTDYTCQILPFRVFE
ncbi:hypothetical protein MSI_13290 [Treponema sp. JC4]|uniref:hypothetical protein n=1 Tax=Treponema sp. JC4 TaxID=1124982 RepID=UPI00025B0E00|nr:hypothetical protein [Treponema sp. JC4]EID85204.1 hypothetical protein MSI_13290 [Treponema sp. JC4]